MSKTFYVSNLGQAMDLTKLEHFFTTVGDVESLRLVIQQESNRGFGIVEMSTEQQAIDCIERFNGQVVIGQRLSVTANRPKPVLRKQK